jgi:TRAP-type C4-dicarboxylate transport system permease small subunit
MFVVAGDTVMRYLLNSPWPWAVELTGNYLLIGAAYLGVSATFTMGDHINIDILQRRLPPKVRAWIDAVFTALFLVVFALIGYLAFSQSLSAWINKDYVPGYIPWPVWLSFAPIPIGTAVLCIRMVHHLSMLLTHGSDPYVVGPHSEVVAK